MLTPLRNRRFSFSSASQGLPQPFAFDPYLFLRPDHLATQSPDPVHYFQLLDNKSQKIIAHFPVFLNDEKGAYSPGRASFGGLQVAPGILVPVLAEFLHRTHETLLQIGKGREIKLKTAPLGFAPAEATHVVNLLLRLGYQVTSSEVNHHLKVSELPFANQAYSQAAFAEMPESRVLFSGRKSWFFTGNFRFYPELPRRKRPYTFSNPGANDSAFFWLPKRIQDIYGAHP
jgi:hypothetical protein